MVLEMQNKFEKYWNISYLTNYIPSILDPEFSFIEFHLKQTYGEFAGDHIAKVDKTLGNLFNGYSSEMGNTTSAAQGNETSTAAPGIIKYQVSSIDVFMLIYFYAMMRASIFYTGGRYMHHSTL